MPADGSANEKKVSAPRCDVAHAWLTTPVYQQLKFEADQYGDHPDRLAAAILTAVLTKGYVDAVLKPI